MKSNFIFMIGVVLKSTGSLYQVLSENKIYPCKIQGKSRLLKIDFTNPIAVGDHVDFLFDQKNQIGLIKKVHERKNYMIRKSVNLTHKTQIIASNIDLAVLIVTIVNPKTSLNFIDRFLVQAEAYGVPVILIFNKVDLYDRKLKIQHKKYEKIYNDIGYKTISTSVISKKNILRIKKILSHKVSVLTGHSGVGKSSLVNLIEPKLNLKTKNISNHHHQGVHTTTYTEMFPLSSGGYIIDTPGIKGLGLVDLDINNLSKYFPEMLRKSTFCKFKNCIHINEPECAVLNAIDEKTISKSRYKSYLSMLEKNTNYRKNDYLE